MAELSAGGSSYLRNHKRYILGCRRGEYYVKHFDVDFRYSATDVGVLRAGSYLCRIGSSSHDHSTTLDYDRGLMANAASADCAGRCLGGSLLAGSFDWCRNRTCYLCSL